MDFIIQKSLKLVESGLVPDQAIRAAIRALSNNCLLFYRQIMLPPLSLGALPGT